jgi:hypothetical protein
MLCTRKIRMFLHLIPGISRDATVSLSLAAFSLGIYLSNCRTIGSGDTVPASLIPIVLLTEGDVYFDAYKQYYEDKGNPYFFGHADSFCGTSCMLDPVETAAALDCNSGFNNHRGHPVNSL